MESERTAPPVANAMRSSPWFGTRQKLETLYNHPGPRGDNEAFDRAIDRLEFAHRVKVWPRDFVLGMSAIAGAILAFVGVSFLLGVAAVFLMKALG